MSSFRVHDFFEWEQKGKREIKRNSEEVNKHYWDSVEATVNAVSTVGLVSYLHRNSVEVLMNALGRCPISSFFTFSRRDSSQQDSLTELAPSPQAVNLLDPPLSKLWSLNRRWPRSLEKPRRS